MICTQLSHSSPLSELELLFSDVENYAEYIKAHNYSVISDPEHYISPEGYAHHTMNEALPLYVGSKIPVRAITRAIEQGDAIEIHGSYPSEFGNIAPALGFKNISLIPFKPQAEGKAHNYIRPQFFWAEKDGKSVLIGAVTPGKDYIHHYAAMVQYFIDRLEKGEKGVSVIRYPEVEQSILSWTGLNEKFVRKQDRIIIGNFDSFYEKLCNDLGVGLVDEEENAFYSSKRYQLKDGSIINFLGVKYSFWGNTSAILAKGLCELGASEIIYVAKLGTLTDPDDIYSKIFMPRDFFRVNQSRIIDKVSGSPNRVLSSHPWLDTGNHASVPTVLEETDKQYAALTQIDTSSIDNEISKIAAAVNNYNRIRAHRPVHYSTVHFATDFLHPPSEKANGDFNLSTNRTPKAQEAKEQILGEIRSLLADYFRIPLQRSPEPNRSFAFPKKVGTAMRSPSGKFFMSSSSHTMDCAKRY